MTLSQRDRILLAVLAVVAVLGGSWYFVVRPASAELADARTELTTVQGQATGLRDTIARLTPADVNRVLDATERLRTAKALPQETAAPGTIVELEAMARRANVDLASLRTLSSNAYGSLVGTEYEVVVTGAFFDVDDFLYRTHRLVEVNERRAPNVRGRLYATRSVTMEPEQEDEEEPQPLDESRVRATVTLLAFSSEGAVEGDVASSATTTPVAAETGTATATNGEATDTSATPPAAGTSTTPAATGTPATPGPTDTAAPGGTVAP